MESALIKRTLAGFVMDHLRGWPEVAVAVGSQAATGRGIISVPAGLFNRDDLCKVERPAEK
jgi:hypothetical protein